MGYIVENIDAYLEKEDQDYTSENPLHITFACRRLDGRDGTQQAFEKLCGEAEQDAYSFDRWIALDDFLEARMNKCRGLDCIEVREKNLESAVQKGYILNVPSILLEHRLIDVGEKNDFDLLLSVSKTLRSLLPMEIETKTRQP